MASPLSVVWKLACGGGRRYWSAARVALARQSEGPGHDSSGPSMHAAGLAVVAVVV